MCGAVRHDFRRGGMITQERFEIQTGDDLKLACVRLVPESSPDAVIHIFHGMGEHKERYLPFMSFLAEHGFAAVAHDHRRHGQSVAEKEGVGMFFAADTWDKVIQDAFLVTRASRERYPHRDIFILGHSMGSMILRRFLFTYPEVAAKAVIMGTLSPFTRSAGFLPLTLINLVQWLAREPRRSEFLARAINRPLLKGCPNPVTPFDWLSRDNTVTDAFIQDPLCGFAYTPRFYAAFIKGIVDLHKADRLGQGRNIPLLFISGSEDPVGRFGRGVRNVVRCYEQAGFTRITLDLVPGARHEVLNEVNRIKTYHTIVNWLKQTG